MSATMQAVLCNRYGPPEELVVGEAPMPVPGERQVLVRVHATAVNDYDWSLVRGKPIIYRLMFGLTRPKRPVPGMELAGVVEAVGPNSSKFRVGDRVYGDISEHGFGTFAEYCAVHDDGLVPLPDGLSFASAAATPHALELAYQALIQIAKLKDRERVLLNGAGGGVGTFCLQLAKRQGCEVWGVDTGPKLKAMKTLGFDRVIDYRETDFTRLDERFDVVVDMKTTRGPRAHARALAPGGRYVTVGGELPRLLQLLLGRLFGRKDQHILPLKPNRDLEALAPLLQRGTLKPVIDGPHPLSETPRLIRYFGEGRHTGKVVVAVHPE